MDLRKLQEIVKEKNRIDNIKPSHQDCINGTGKFYERKQVMFEELISREVILITNNQYNNTMAELMKTKLSPTRVMSEGILNTIMSLHKQILK